jgi:hypothetical protein
MSEPFNRQRHEINLDAFERSLRDEPLQTKPAEDPLAELARLVGRDDPFKSVFDSAGQARQAPAQDAFFPGESMQPPPAQVPPVSPAMRAEAAKSWNSYEEDQPRRQEPPMTARPVADPWDDESSEADGFVPPHVAARKPRKGLYALMGGAAIAVLAVGGLFAMKSSGVTSVGGVPFIKASNEPTKIQPQVASADGDSQNISILDHSSDRTNTPTKVVNNEEQPMDLTQAAEPSAPHPLPSEPKKVRTVSVRADGTVIGGMPSVPPPPQVQQAATQPVAAAPAPASDEPQAPAAPRLFMPIGPAPVAIPQTAPVTPGGKSAETQHPQAVQSTATPKTAVRPAVKTASAATATTGTPTDLAPKTKPAVQAKTNVASAETADPTTTGATGNYAVQLAAEGSEQDAKAKSSKLAAQYGSALGGRRLSIREAASGGKTVYRVRVAGMSHEEAVSTCEKLKSSGGTCFIAKD